MGRRSWAAAAVVLATGWDAAAQTVAPPPGVEEVLVTARKKEERLQDTPISITAFTAAALERTGATSMVDIAKRTPNLQIGEYSDIKLAPTSLRGVVGGSGSAGADPAVGYYVDEIFVGQGAGADIDLYDIERVEVLRGPQGTLFGRNTIGGVLSITTKRPSDTFEASVTGEFGNKDYRRIGASISGPIVQGKVAAKLAAIYDARDGFEHNVWLNRNVNNQGSWSARGQVSFTFSDDTDLLLTYEHRSVNQHPLVFETLRYNDAMTLPQLLDARGLPRNTNPYDRNVYADTITSETLRLNGIGATFRTRIGDVRITNIASYRAHRYFSRDDTDRSPLSMLYDGDPERVWRLSEEFRLDFSTGPVDWLAGVYYFRQNTNNQSFVEVGRDLAALLGDPSLAGLRTGSNGMLDTTSLSGFFSATWAITDTFDVTAGGRYTKDWKKINYVQSDPISLLGGNARIGASDSWAEFTPNFNARWRFAPDMMAYVTVSKGFKSGGFNDALGSADGIAFNPETLWNYEAGLKASLFDRRVVANLAAFYMKWDNIQISEDDPRTPVFDPIILNGGAAHTQGVELDVKAQAAKGLTLGFAGSVLEAKYDKGLLPDGRLLKKIPYAPDFTANFNAEYRFPVNWGDVSIFGEYLVRGTSYLTDNNQPDGKVTPYGLLNLRVALESPDGRWRVALWAKNLTDETYKTRLFDLSEQQFVGQKFVVLGAPRTFGVDFKISY